MCINTCRKRLKLKWVDIGDIALHWSINFVNAQTDNEWSLAVRKMFTVMSMCLKVQLRMCSICQYCCSHTGTVRHSANINDWKNDLNKLTQETVGCSQLLTGVITVQWKCCGLHCGEDRTPAAMGVHARGEWRNCAGKTFLHNCASN